MKRTLTTLALAAGLAVGVAAPALACHRTVTVHEISYTGGPLGVWCPAHYHEVKAWNTDPKHVSTYPRHTGAEFNATNNDSQGYTAYVKCSR
jgi:hypothetical protein